VQCCGTEAGSYLRLIDSYLRLIDSGGLVFEAHRLSYVMLIDSFITQLKDHGPSRTCNESKEQEEEAGRDVRERSCSGSGV